MSYPSVARVLAAAKAASDIAWEAYASLDPTAPLQERRILRAASAAADGAVDAIEAAERNIA